MHLRQFVQFSLSFNQSYNTRDNNVPFVLPIEGEWCFHCMYFKHMLTALIFFTLQHIKENLIMFWCLPYDLGMTN